MPKSAMPPWIQEKAGGTGTDWDNPFQRWIKKSWFAYGPRATEWFAKWREFPLTLFAYFGEGSIRLETESWERDSASEITYPIRYNGAIFFAKFGSFYLSNIQYYTRWGISIQWPLHIIFHYYLRSKDVREVGSPKNERSPVLFFRFGARRDADKVYWFPSLFLGLTFN